MTPQQQDPLAELLKMKRAAAQQPATNDPLAELLKLKNEKPRGTTRSWAAPTHATAGQQFGALAASGATLGFAPKILGGIDAANAMLPKSLGGESMPARDFGNRYATTRDRIMDAADEGVEHHPIAGRAVELGAGLAATIPSMVGRTALAGMSAAERVPLMVRMARNAVHGARTGAAIGAVAGAGHATGGVEDYAHEMANGAAFGGVVGAGASAVVPPLLSAAGSVAGKAVTAVGLRPTGRTALEMAIDRMRMRSPQGPEAPTQPATFAAAGATPESSAPTIGEKMRARFGAAAERAGVETSKTRALREVMRRLELDNVSPDDAVSLATNNPGKPLAVLDLGHNNVADLARTAKDVPSLAKRDIPEFLHHRSAGTRGDEGRTLQRVTGDFEHRIGLKPENYFQTVDQMTAEMKKNAASDYGKIRGTVVEDPEVLSIFNEPEFRGVHESIRTNARLRRAEPIPPLTSDEITFGKKITSQNPQTIGTLDKMKRHLDQIIAGKIEGGAIGRDAAYAMRERLNAGLDRLDELHPDYQAARAKYRGSAEAIEAFEQGRKDFHETDPRLVQAKLAEMPERLRDLYRRGAYDGLRSRLLKMDDGSNIGAWLEKNPDIRERVAALAKSEGDVELLRDDLGLERHMGNRKNQILGGPNTAERLIGHESTVPRVTQAGNLARNLPGIGKLAGSMLDNSITRRTAEQTGDVMGEVGKIMTRSGPEGMRLTAEEIRKLQMRELIKQLRTRTKVSTAGGLAGARFSTDRP